MRDLRYAIRVLLKAPAFTITAVFTLALCIGANTAIYTVVDRVLLRPLPYPQPERLAEVVTRFSRGGHRVRRRLAEPGRRCSAAVTSVELATTAGGFGSTGVNMVVGTHAEYVKQQRVSAAFFRVLGVPPALGREFTADEDRASGPTAAILSHQLWTRLFNGDPGASRPLDHAARRAAHDRRRDARWLHDWRTDGRVDAGAAVPDVRRRRRELRHHRPVEAGRDVDPGRRGDRRRRATRRSHDLYRECRRPGARTADSAAARPDRSRSASRFSFCGARSPSCS